MDLKGLKKLVGSYNKLEVKDSSGEVIVIEVGKKDSLETLGRKFLDGVWKTPESAEDELNKEHKEVWDAVCASFDEVKEILKAEKSKPEEKVQEKKKVVGKKPAPISKAPISKAPVQKEVKKSSNGKGPRGCRPGSISAFIFDMVSDGISLDDAAKKLDKKFQRKRPAGDFKRYVEYYQKKGYNVKIKDGFYKLA